MDTKRKYWPKWLIGKSLKKYNYVSFVGYKDGYFTVILESFDDKMDKNKIKLVWNTIYSYMVTNESYREDVWIGEEDEFWPFYKIKDSQYISTFKSINTIYKEDDIYHYVIVGEDVVDILSDEEPAIVILDNIDNTIKEFSEINGEYVDEIYGQTKFGYCLSDNEEFFDIPEIIQHNGYYKGSVIKFHDFETGDVFTPFQLEKNIQYGLPIYIDMTYYFLQADFNKSIVSIYQYYPDKYLNKIEEFKMEDLNLYNLRLIGEELHLLSQYDKLEIYYPFKLSIDLASNESVMFIKDNKIYISAWVENGWDDKNNIAGPNYEYYNKIVIKDMDGKTKSERRGYLFQHIDGTWRLA